MKIRNGNKKNLPLTILAGLLTLFCESNHMYDDLLLQSSPDYYLQISLYDTTTNMPLSGFRVTAYRENRDSFQLSGDIGFSEQMMWAYTDGDGLVTMHLPGDYYRLMIQTPEPDLFPFGSLMMAVTPKGSEFRKAPEVKFSNTGGVLPYLVQAIPIIPTGEPLRFTAMSLPDITIHASQSIMEYPQPIPVAGVHCLTFLKLPVKRFRPWVLILLLTPIPDRFFLRGS